MGVCVRVGGGGGVAALSKGLGGKQLCDNIKQLGREELWSYIEKKKSKMYLTADRQKGGDMNQSYDKSPYTNRNVKRAK